MEEAPADPLQETALPLPQISLWSPRAALPAQYFILAEPLRQAVSWSRSLTVTAQLLMRREDTALILCLWALIPLMPLTRRQATADEQPPPLRVRTRLLQRTSL